ncbi:thioesterase family protein [Mycobacterium sp.]|uniref:thioesterase family protein n=1 Tax=Mycobacterium sp. TaxID=1785 RepID=UPI002B694B0E|nr:thioesterase family protein [Mycobacterium sp.]HME50503.1 thioesterase family protein [Mycobacterium sp.]
MTGSTLFSDAMALRQVDDGRFQGELNEHWTIGPKVHGGAMLALCAGAARAAHGGTVQPVAVSASYLSAPDPGPMRLQTFVRKRGRTVSVVEVELSQGDQGDQHRRACVHAVITLGEPEHRAAPLLSANPVVPLMDPEPPPDAQPIGPGHPMAGLVNLAAGCEVRPLMSTVPMEGMPPDGRPPLIQMWVRPRGAAPDILFALMCGDISVPVAFAVGRRGWAPTVQLTAYLRGVPADGWLRVLCTTTQIGRDWFDEDHIVVDSDGRVVVQTRQLALVPSH